MLFAQADGAISADLFGGDAAPPSYLTPMGGPSIGPPQPYGTMQPAAAQAGMQPSLGMPPPAVVQPPAFASQPFPAPDGVESLVSLGFQRAAAIAALQDCGGSVERAAHQLLAGQPAASVAPSPALPGGADRPGLKQLMAMGYSQTDANAALDQNSNVQAAADWLAQGYRAQPAALAGGITPRSSGGVVQPTLAASDDPFLPAHESQGSSDVVRLQEMGYSRADAEAALTANGGDLQRSADWLMSGNTAPALTPAPAPAPVRVPSAAAQDAASPSSTAGGGSSARPERRRRTSVDEIEKFFGWADAGGGSGDGGGEEARGAAMAFDDEFDPRASDGFPPATSVVADASGSTREETVAPAATTGRWQWRCKDGWQDYADGNNAILERGYLAYRENVRSLLELYSPPTSRQQADSN